MWGQDRGLVKSELMDLRIGYRWKEMFGGFDRDPETIEWTKA
jgi:hypothetical protein